MHSAPVIKSNKLSAMQMRVVRKRLLQMHYESGVGHIGGNLSALDAIALLFNEYIGPEDKFILSKGHSAGAVYAALWSIGSLTDADLKTFHKDNTLLAGHPPARGITDIPFATGSLGHGLSLAAGTALALRLKKKEGHVFCLTSDGEWQEGSTWEALMFACHQGLNNLTVLIDQNNLQGFGSTGEVASMYPLWEKLSGFDLHHVTIDGHDLDAIRQALDAPTQEKPRFIFLKTVKGHGVSFMENKMEWHYLPMSEAQYLQAISEINQ